jgi:hypothetical protein
MVRTKTEKTIKTTTYGNSAGKKEKSTNTLPGQKQRNAIKDYTG